MNCVYILKSEKNGKHYIGSTNNLPRRIEEHNRGIGCFYTKINRPWELICCKKCETIEQARLEEKKVKSYKGGNAFKKIISGKVAEWLKAAGC